MAADYKFTGTDLENVNCAINQIVSGKRLITLQLGDRTDQWQATRLEELLELRDRIASEINAGATTQATRRPTAYRSTFNHGF